MALNEAPRHESILEMLQATIKAPKVLTQIISGLTTSLLMRAPDRSQAEGADGYRKGNDGVFVSVALAPPRAKHGEGDHERSEVVVGFLAFLLLYPQTLMPTTYKPKIALARKMRRAMSEPEWLLWERLRTRGEDGLNFRRQHAIGPFILDFYSAKAKLAVEVDGSQHYNEDYQAKDASRDAWLNAKGIEVYRIPAGEVYRNADDAADGAISVALARVETLRRK